MQNAWTGGQYSLWRAITGILLAVLFVRAASVGGGGPEWRIVHTGSALAAICFAIGWRDRAAAAIVVVALLATFALEPGELLLLHPVLVLPLGAHFLVPTAPFGSVAARGRADPDGGWRFPEAVHGALWGVMSGLFTFTGVAEFARLPEGNLYAVIPLPSEALLRLPFACAALVIPLAVLWRRARPAIWCVGLVVILSGVSRGLGLGFLATQLLLFDPGWIPSLGAAVPDRVFYDGSCGFCHRSIRILIAEDREGNRFRYAPRASTAFAAAVGAEERATLPDSIVVLSGEGDLLIRSTGTVRMLRRLGGVWRIFGTLVSWVPRPLRDLGYRGVAVIRHRIAASPDGVCPVLSPDLRARFLPGADEELPA